MIAFFLGGFKCKPVKKFTTNSPTSIEYDRAQGNFACTIIGGSIPGFRQIRKSASEMYDLRLQCECARRRPPGIIAFDAWIMWKDLEVLLDQEGVLMNALAKYFRISPQ